MKTVAALLLTCATTLPSMSPAFAQNSEHNLHHPLTATAASSEPAGQSMTAGEIRKVDKDAGKITIRHEELKNLDMPAMTMVFRVKDPAMLEQVKAGDKVKFVADKIGGQYVVTEVEVTE